MERSLERSPIDELVDARQSAMWVSANLAVNRKNADAWVRCGSISQRDADIALASSEDKVKEAYERLYWCQAGAAKYLAALTEPPVARGNV